MLAFRRYHDIFNILLGFGVSFVTWLGQLTVGVQITVIVEVSSVSWPGQLKVGVQIIVQHPTRPVGNMIRQKAYRKEQQLLNGTAAKKLIPIFF
jgi:hypothetical protein